MVFFKWGFWTIESQTLPNPSPTPPQPLSNPSPALPQPLSNPPPAESQYENPVWKTVLWIIESFRAMCFSTVSSKPCLEVLPYSILQTPLTGHCLGALWRVKPCLANRTHGGAGTEGVAILLHFSAVLQTLSVMCQNDLSTLRLAAREGKLAKHHFKSWRHTGRISSAKSRWVSKHTPI